MARPAITCISSVGLPANIPHKSSQFPTPSKRSWLRRGAYLHAIGLLQPTGTPLASPNPIATANILPSRASLSLMLRPRPPCLSIVAPQLSARPCCHPPSLHPFWGLTLCCRPALMGLRAFVRLYLSGSLPLLLFTCSIHLRCDSSEPTPQRVQ